MHRYVFAALVAFVPVTAFAAADSAGSNPELQVAETTPLAVVELFTSQGCNSCPPADKFASELAQRPGVLVLSWNVDYWDYMGWKDTLARPENTARQRAYNKALGRGSSVFTPQMVIGGRDYAIGSSRLDVETALADPTNLVAQVPVRYQGDTISLDLPERADVKNATVKIVHYEFAETVPVGRGENIGKALTYTHVVKKTDLVSQWDGKAALLTISRDRFCDKGNAIIVQQGEAGPILHAAIIDISKTRQLSGL